MPETERPSRRQPRLSDEERKRFWREAVMEKARRLKDLADIVILVMLALAILAHALPFVKGGRGLKTYDGELNSTTDVVEQRRGYQLLIDLVVPYSGDVSALEEKDPYWKDRLPEPPEITWGVQPRLVYTRDPATGSFVQDRYGNPWEKRYRNVYPATITAYLLAAVSFGAVVLFVLYLVDRKIWMGRVLPGLSVVHGFGSVLYLMLTKVPTDGSWNAMRYGSALAWYLLLIPLFLVGSVSLLRFVVSQRWKRYVWAGQEIPEHLKPPEPEEEPGEKSRAARRGLRAAAKPAGKPEPEEGKAAADAGQPAPGSTDARPDAGQGEAPKESEEKGE